MHYFDGTIHVYLTTNNLISRMQEIDNYVLPVTTSNQYIIICLGLNNAQQQAVEQFNFVGDNEGYYFKVYSDHLDHVSIVDEMCEHQKPIDDIVMPEVFTPQKLAPISTDTFVDEKPVEVEFCELPMDLYIFVNTTYNMWRQMDYGKDLKQVLKKLAKAYFREDENDTGSQVEVNYQ